MAKKNKYYTVWEGSEVGVFDSWTKCQSAVKGYAGAKFKSFSTRKMAEEAYLDDYKKHIGKEKKVVKTIPDHTSIIKESIAVDAACSGNPGKMEYRGIDLLTGLELFRIGVFEDGTNNIGEFLAIVHALALTQDSENPMTIYSDSKVAIGWIKQKKCKTKVTKTSKNSNLFEVIERAERWLKENNYETDILKWNTKEWGEIPADFGRK